MSERPLNVEIIRRVDVVLVALVLAVAALFGGSSLAGVERHAFIQLAAIPLLVWLAVRSRPVPFSPATRVALGLIAGLAVYGLCQTVAIGGLDWKEGTPRALVEAAQPMLGLEPASVGLSLAPGETVSAVLALTAPLAVFFAVATGRWTYTVEAAIWGVVLLAGLSAGLGLGQLFAGPDSPLYLYGASDQSLGLFSNPHHQASFLVMALPVSVALLLDKGRDLSGSDGETGLFILATGLFLLLVAGIIAARSMTGHALLVGVIPLCILMSVPGADRRGLALSGPVLLLALVAGAGATLYAGLNPGLGWSETGSPAARAEVWRQSLVIARDHFPFGAGLGAFEYVYPLYETEVMISSRYMNAAHNEYLQALVELGLVGIVLAVVALGLWGVLSLGAWQSKGNNEGRIRRAASISGMVVIVHSLVDYPLHAPVYAIVAALLAAILCLPPRHARQASQRRPATAERRIEL